MLEGERRLPQGKERMKHTISVGWLAIAALLGAASCGDDDGDSAPSGLVDAGPAGTDDDDTPMEDDDTPAPEVTPELSIDDPVVAEGDEGTTELTFTVSLSEPAARRVTVAYATSDGTATAEGMPRRGTGDYVAASGTVAFAPGVTEAMVSVSVRGDEVNEDDETVRVTLSNPSGATLDDDAGEGTISNDDPLPEATVAGVSVREGNNGTRTAELTVTLSAASGRDVAIDWATSDGSAVADDDYTADDGTVSFEPGETTASIRVSVAGDRMDEEDETFTVMLEAASGAELAGAMASVTIEDDDDPPMVSIADGNSAEGDDGTTEAELLVTLSEPSGRTVTVAYASEDDTAIDGEDYHAGSGVVTFEPGEVQRVVTIALIGDTVPELDETLTVSLSDAENAAIDRSMAVLTVANDDGALHGLSIDDVEIAEGNAETAVLSFTVSLSLASEQEVTVDFTTTDDVATASGDAAEGGADYVATAGTLTFPPGETVAMVEVVVQGDMLNEADETLLVDLSNAVNGTITDAQGVGTITNDDPEPSLSIGDVMVAEGAAGTRVAALAVSLSEVSGRPVSVDFSTSDDTASEEGDYVAATGTVTLAPGETSALVEITVLGDLLNEPDEAFFVDLENPVNATIADAQATGTITNDDPVPAIYIGDVSVVEGNTGTRSAIFAVTLSAESAQDVSVDFATADDTATAGSDYASSAGTLEFPAGTVSQMVSVLVNGDTTDELAETFFVDLANPVNATLADARAVGTIIGDDGDVSQINLNDASVAEGNAGTVTLSFALTLDVASDQVITVDWATSDGTAAAGTDYTAATGTATFAIGETMTTIDVGVLGDTLHEPNETLTLTLSNPTNGYIGDGVAAGTVTDDDVAPEVSIGDASVLEGNTGTASLEFTVSLSAPSAFDITVVYATADDSATQGGLAGVGGDDYEAASDVVTFAAGETMKTITVSVNGDDVTEGDEIVLVQLSSPENATILDGEGAGTISNDDALPVIDIDDVSETEGNQGGVKSFTFTVTLSHASATAVSVDFGTSNGTAQSSQDYVMTTGTVTFAPGDTSETLQVTVDGDNANETDETFFVDLSNPVGGTIGDGQGQGTIISDD